MGGGRDGGQLGALSFTRPLPANPREGIEAPQAPQPDDMGTTIPGLVSGVIEQSAKAPAPSGGSTTGAATQTPTAIPPPGPIAGSPDQNAPRRPLSISLPTGASLAGPQGPNNLNALNALFGGGKGAK